MTTLIVLPHVELCPDGAVIDAEPGQSICDALLQNDIPIDHACEKSCACTTCHVVVRDGFNSLEPAEDLEEDLLDKAWGLEPTSRLSCQALVGDTPLTVEIPKYSINMVKEGKRGMKWTDVQEIAIQLSEAYPEVDPLKINFVDLMKWTMALPEFDDDPKHCGERILEGIQQAWIEEVA